MKEPRRRTLKTIQSKRADQREKNPEYRILRTDHPGGPIITSGHVNVKLINKPQDWIIGTLNELINLQDRITETLKEERSRICTHKSLNARKPYPYAQAA